VLLFVWAKADVPTVAAVAARKPRRDSGFALNFVIIFSVKCGQLSCDLFM
jgi:hypothetical protein